MSWRIETVEGKPRTARWGTPCHVPLPKLPANAVVKSVWFRIDEECLSATFATRDGKPLRTLRWFEHAVEIEPRPCGSVVVTVAPQVGEGSSGVTPVVDVVVHEWAGAPDFAADPAGMRGAHKLVVVVNQALGMDKGKIASQVGHAVAAVTEACVTKWPKLWTQYKAQGQPKITLKTADIEAVAALPGAFPVYDQGKTQVAAGSLTAVGFVPTKEAHARLHGLKLL